MNINKHKCVQKVAKVSISQRVFWTKSVWVADILVLIFSIVFIVGFTTDIIRPIFNHTLLIQTFDFKFVETLIHLLIHKI